MDDLDHHLLRLDGGEDVLAHGLDLHPVAEFLRHLVADIGIQQGPADVLKGLGYVYFGNPAFALQNLEGPFKSLL